MSFGIAIDSITGKAVCPCCRDYLWHCWMCWRDHHNGLKYKDFEPPEYYGQSMMPEDVQKKMSDKYGIEHNPSIKPDKNRKYKEGEYH